VRATLHCTNARCAGKVQITKFVPVKIQIGHSGKYKVETKVVVIGTASYAMAARTVRQLTIQLNAAGVKLLNSTIGHHFTCELTVTGAGGTKHENVSLTVR
jgi:hypothetical protein